MLIIVHPLNSQGYDAHIKCFDQTVNPLIEALSRPFR